MGKHTKEPWYSKQWRIVSIKEDGTLRAYICDTANNTATRTPENEANAHRIVACVNAMAGVSDPAALVASHAELVRACERAADSSNQQAVPGSGSKTYHILGHVDVDALRSALSTAKALTKEKP